MKNLQLKILFLLSILAAMFAGCSNAHQCNYDLCPFIGQHSFHTTLAHDCVQGSDCWALDSIHFEHPDWNYDNCESYLFGERVIDLPEEISLADSSDILRARVTADTIFIYFDNNH